MSALEAAGVWIVDAHGRTLLEPTTVAVDPGQIAVVSGPPGYRHPLLALALGGRIPLNGGEVTLDGDSDPRVLRDRVALVDVPGVSEPEEATGLRTLVGEELAMAGKPAGRRHTEAWLTSNAMWAHHRDRVEDLPPGVRLLALARLAALRPGVRFLVLARPERNGVDPGAWLETAESLAGDGFGVLATVTPGVAELLRGHAPAVAQLEFANAVFHDEEV